MNNNFLSKIDPELDGKIVSAGMQMCYLPYLCAQIWLCVRNRITDLLQPAELDKTILS